MSNMKRITSIDALRAITLFGISFYLILRNPANTGKKFVWRCFLLVLIGLFLEPYGMLGLTNYSMQGTVGVILSGLVFIPCHWPFEYILTTMLLFYVLHASIVQYRLVETLQVRSYGMALEMWHRKEVALKCEE